MLLPRFVHSLLRKEVRVTPQQRERALYEDRQVAWNLLLIKACRTQGEIVRFVNNLAYHAVVAYTYQYKNQLGEKVDQPHSSNDWNQEARSREKIWLEVRKEVLECLPELERMIPLFNDSILRSSSRNYNNGFIKIKPNN